MHTHQDDHLLVLHGTRDVEIYTPAHGRIERFVAEPDRVEIAPDRARARGIDVEARRSFDNGWTTGVVLGVLDADEGGAAAQILRRNGLDAQQLRHWLRQSPSQLPAPAAPARSASATDPPLSTV